MAFSFDMWRMRCSVRWHQRALVSSVTSCSIVAPAQLAETNPPSCRCFHSFSGSPWRLSWIKYYKVSAKSSAVGVSTC